MTIETLVYTQAASLVVFIITIFVLYRLLVEQKEATIQLLKEKNDWLQKELEIAKASSVNVLVRALNDRLQVGNEELERLLQDKTTDQSVIQEKTEQLERTKAAILNAIEAMKDASDVLAIMKLILVIANENYVGSPIYNLIQSKLGDK